MISHTKTKTINVALAGNPNCGKTTLFNGLTGSTQRIGNWPGVTVEKKEGTFKGNNFEYNIVDLPGIYSLSAHSEDEKAARDYLLSGEVNLVVNIVDSTNLERNLFLTTQILEMRVPVLLLLNMHDLAEKRSLYIDADHLAKHLGCDVIPITATNDSDIDAVKSAIIEGINHPKTWNGTISYHDEIESIITAWNGPLAEISTSLGVEPRWTAVKLLEEDEWIKKTVVENGALTRDQLDSAANSIEKILEDTPDILIADARYGYIHGINKDVVQKGVPRQSATEKIDSVVMSRILGIPIFLAAMYLVFWVTITVGGAFIDFFDILFGAVFVDGFSVLLESMSAPPWVIGILASGVGAGIQTVATFIPVIFFMFFMLSLLEDSGYMARAAFVMDRFLRTIGLPGKAFVPMMVGFGCSVPAMMGARTLENRSDRLTTTFMTPFMSCGARLPVYALFGAAFFPKNAGFLVFSLYIAGIILAILTGLLIKKTILKGSPSHFVMELPPYHMPRLKHIFRHTWNRLTEFMFRAGKVIVFAVVILAFLNTLGTDGSIGNDDSESSVLASIGKTIAPVFSPMGIEKDNWPATVGIFTGLFAKEAVVGTLNSLYSQMAVQEGEIEEDGSFDIIASIQKAFASIGENLAGVFGGLTDPLGVGILKGSEEEIAEEVEADSAIFNRMRANFNIPGAYSFLLFILIYAPCVAALGTAVREMGPFLGWFQALYLTVLGWIVATLYYQFTFAGNAVTIAGTLALLAALISSFFIIAKVRKPVTS